MSKITEDEVELIIQLYKEGISATAIAQEINHSTDGVIGVLNRNGICTSNDIFNRLTEEEIGDICRMYQDKVRTQLIVDKYYPKIKSQNTIIKIVKKNGISIRRPGVPTKIVNEDFFEEIDTEEKAYIVGFLIADGYVVYPKTRCNRNPVWGITIHENDAYILEKIKQIIGIEKKTCGTRKEKSLIVTSKQMVEDLSKYGIVPQKSFETFLPKINKEYERHLIRGIFDGDGCISNGVCSFYGNDELLIGIQDVLNMELGIRKGKITIRKTNGADSISFAAKENVLKFYHYMYDDATIYLKRKRLKFEQLKFITDEC